MKNSEEVAEERDVLSARGSNQKPLQNKEAVKEFKQRREIHLEYFSNRNHAIFLYKPNCDSISS